MLQTVHQMPEWQMLEDGETYTLSEDLARQLVSEGLARIVDDIREAVVAPPEFADGRAQGKKR